MSACEDDSKSHEAVVQIWKCFACVSRNGLFIRVRMQLTNRKVRISERARERGKEAKGKTRSCGLSHRSSFRDCPFSSSSSTRAGKAENGAFLTFL